MDWFPWVRRIVLVLAVVWNAAGYVLAILYTIMPPPVADRQQVVNHIYWFAAAAVILAILALWVEDKNARRHQHELLEAVGSLGEAMERTATCRYPEQPPPTPTSTGTPPPIHLNDLGDAAAAAEVLGGETDASKTYKALPEPKTLKDQSLNLIQAAKKSLKHYHGSLDADSFVSPEFSSAFTTALLAVKNKVQNQLGHQLILRPEARFPVTVRRMRMFLEDLENATYRVPDVILPADVPSD